MPGGSSWTSQPGILVLGISEGLYLQGSTWVGRELKGRGRGAGTMVISSRGTVIAAVAAAAVFAPGADAFAPGFLAPMSGMPRALSHPARAQAPATGPRMVAAPERDVNPHRRRPHPLHRPREEHH